MSIANNGLIVGGAGIGNTVGQQRPPRSYRASKTSQGTRPRNTQPLIQNGYDWDETGRDKFTSVANDTSQLSSAQGPYGQHLEQTFSQQKTEHTFHQNSFNGLMADLKRHKRALKGDGKGGRRRKQSTQNPHVTLFHQVKTQSKGTSLLVKDRSSRKLKRSTISNRSRSSSKSGRSTPTSQKGGKVRSSLNFGKRTREQNAISAENMRFVAQLVNVKPTVPGKFEVGQRDRKHKALKKNMMRRSLGAIDFTNSKHGSSGSHQGSRIGTPLSTHSGGKREKASPKIDLRLKSKALKSFYKIQSSPQAQSRPQKHVVQDLGSSTPPYLKMRKFDQKNLAMMYEADDHLLFGNKKGKRKRCDSETSSKGSRQGSARRSKHRKKSKQRQYQLVANLGETGSDGAVLDQYSDVKFQTAINTMEVLSNPSNHGMPKSQQPLHVLSSTNSMLGQQDSILEHTGPKPNPAGQSLIQKMNHLMSQKTGKNSEQSRHVISEHTNQNMMMIADHEQIPIAREKENSKPHQAKQHRKSLAKKVTRSIPRHQGKRKSVQDAMASHPFAMNGAAQKAALLSGYYSNAAQRTTLKSRQATRQNSLPPRTVKTATVRHPAMQQPDQSSSFDCTVNTSQKISPQSKNTMSYQFSRTTNNATSTTGGGKRRIIVAVNKTLDQEARNTDSGWNRAKRNQTSVENPRPAQGKTRPPIPQSANPSGTSKPQREQNLRAYQDMRKKFLTDKLFSPVLKSQHSSQASANFDQALVPIKKEDESGEETSLLPQEIIIQGGLRPRVTRTAEGNSRPRARKTIADETHYEPGESELLPQIIKPVPVKQDDQDELKLAKNWLTQGSSTGEERSQKTLQSHSVAQIAHESAVRKSLNDRSAPFVVSSQTKFNIESQDTFNVPGSRHNIKEEPIADIAQIKAGDTMIVASSSKNIFHAPKVFNQISEEGGDESDDGSHKLRKVASDKQGFGETKKLEGAINIDLELVSGADGKEGTVDGDTEVEGEQLGLLVEEETDKAMPKEYPRLI